MRSNFLPALAVLASLGSADELPSPENNIRNNGVERLVTYQKVEVVWGKVGFPSVHHPNNHNETGGDLNARAVLTSNGVLDLLLNRRQTCQAGYGLCSGKLARLGCSSWHQFGALDPHTYTYI